MSNANISAVILTKNEQEVISNSLLSISWVAEILLIDDYSTDNTTKIARRYSAKVYKRHLNDDFASQRNFALSKAKNEWVLFVDADEVVTDSLRKKIEETVKDTNANGFKIKRTDIWMGKTLKTPDHGEAYILRLARKNKGKWKRRVHEYWDIKEPVLKIDEPLLHCPHQSVSSFVSHVARYSNLHANENIREGKNGSLLHVFIFPIGKFLKSFIWDRAYRDGVQGLIYSVMLSFHSFLAWGTIWSQKHK